MLLKVESVWNHLVFQQGQNKHPKMSRSQNAKEQKIIPLNVQLQTLLLPCSNSPTGSYSACQTLPARYGFWFSTPGSFSATSPVLSFLAFTNDWIKRESLSQWDSFLGCPKLQFHECKMFSVLYFESSTWWIKPPLNPLILWCRFISNSHPSKLPHSSHTHAFIHSGVTKGQNLIAKLVRVSRNETGQWCNSQAELMDRGLKLKGGGVDSDGKNQDVWTGKSHWQEDRKREARQ